MAPNKIAPLKGFPEWLPEQRMIELRFIDRLRATFELHGYAPIETRSVEPLEFLLKKGATDKEIYVLRRLHATEDESDKLGLHFDLTIPFARYIAQHRGAIAFPMRRYQIQKAWRGERPQEGRYREFYQADADVIAEGELPLVYDAEMTLLLVEATRALDIPPVTVRVNNRKILEGFYRGVGIHDFAEALRIADKLDKIGAEAVRAQWMDSLGISTSAADRCLLLAQIRGSDKSVLRAIEDLGVKNETLEAGLFELGLVLKEAAAYAPNAVVADLSIARGLDYYTGIVFEGSMQGHESIGSVCSGGRYDDLAGSMTHGTKLPGIGVSVGLSRILGRLFGQNLLQATRSSPTCVLVACDSDDTQDAAWSTARTLRARGIATEVFDRPQKYGKQIHYAERKGIPFVWFPRAPGFRETDEVKDVRSGKQENAHPNEWTPPLEDRTVRIKTVT